MKKLFAISLLIVIASGCSWRAIESTAIVEAQVVAKHQYHSGSTHYPYRVRLSHRVNEIEEKFRLNVSGEFYKEVLEGDFVRVKKFTYESGKVYFTWPNDSSYADSLEDVKVKK